MNLKNRIRRNALIAATTLVAAVCMPRPASAQDYGAMVQQSVNRMNQIIANAQQASNNMVQQRMRDPQVQASYQQHLAQSRASGRQAMDFPTYTYNWIHTRGFTREGIAHAQASENGMRANEMAAVQRLRDAQAGRGAAMQQQRDSYFANQGEAGRGLMARALTGRATARRSRCRTHGRRTLATTTKATPITWTSRASTSSAAGTVTGTRSLARTSTAPKVRPREADHGPECGRRHCAHHRALVTAGGLRDTAAPATSGTTVFSIALPIALAASARSNCAWRLIQKCGVVPNNRPRRKAISAEMPASARQIKSIRRCGTPMFFATR